MSKATATPTTSEISRRWSALPIESREFSGHREACTRKGCWAAADRGPHEFRFEWTAEGAPIHGRAVASGDLPGGHWRVYLEAIGDAPWTVHYVRTRTKDDARRLLTVEDVGNLGRNGLNAFLAAMESAAERRDKLNANRMVTA